VFLLDGMELLQVAQNENKVTLAVHQIKILCLSDTKAAHSRLTMTEEPNSDPLFPPENV